MPRRRPLPRSGIRQTDPTHPSDERRFPLVLNRRKVHRRHLFLDRQDIHAPSTQPADARLADLLPCEAVKVPRWRVRSVFELFLSGGAGLLLDVDGFRRRRTRKCTLDRCRTPNRRSHRTQALPILCIRIVPYGHTFHPYRRPILFLVIPDSTADGEFQIAHHAPRAEARQYGCEGFSDERIVAEVDRGRKDG